MIELRSFREPRCRPGYNSAELPWEFHPEVRLLEEGFRKHLGSIKGSGVYVISSSEHTLYIGSTTQGGHRVGASLARVTLYLNCDPSSLKAVFFPVGDDVLEEAENTLIMCLKPTLNYYRRWPSKTLDPRPPWNDGEGVFC